MTPVRSALSLLAASSILTPASIAQTFLGPDPYLSEADKPAGFLMGSHVVETFEDLSLDYGLTVNIGAPIPPSPNVDSVDGDDGVIDGSGNGGASFFGFGPVTFTFPAPVKEAGIVWTDAAAFASVTFEAFGPGMVSLGVHGPFMHADGSNGGETAEDRFYGIQDPNGIVAIEIRCGGNQSFEVDHVQFPTLGTSYCSPAPNSTGETGIQTVMGSRRVADNEVTLVASRLPLNAFGYFLTSTTQGFVANAGGSQGNLCLGGAVGRFNAGIFNTGANGHGILPIDLTAIPTPTGATAIQAGETWHFQAWHRDSFGGTTTSNFTDAVSVTFG